MGMTQVQAAEVQVALRLKHHALGAGGPNRDGVDGDYGPTTHRAALAAIAASPALALAPAPIPVAGRALTEADYRAAAAKLTQAAGRVVTLAHVMTIKKIESNGAWFTDIRADILSSDGDPDGGFIHGDMPKILFEAHKFSAKTGGRFNASHPNLSSPRWNKALYVGGQGEYARLARAMALDEQAALESASVGLFQVLGEHWRALGYASVHAFWEANKASEGGQLDAFIRYVVVNRLADELAAGGKSAASWVPFVERYNGTGYAANAYHTKAAAEFARLTA